MDPKKRAPPWPGLGLWPAVSAVLCERLVVVYALFVLVEYLDLGSHAGDARDHLLLLSIQKGGRSFPLDHQKHVHVFFLFLLPGQRWDKFLHSGMS